MPKVSIIMPCLNVVKFLKQCIDSVINQTLIDIEILIIDAGSTDGTLEILSEYQKKDSRIRLLHSAKKSYGYQVNQGISIAAGEYIGIVETDDFVQADMFDVLYAKALETKADYVKGISEAFCQGKNGVEWKYLIIPCKELMHQLEYCARPKDSPNLFLYDNFIWNGIYRKEFIQNIKLSETPGAAFQDIGALFQIISKADKGVYIKHLVYHYRQDNLDASSYNKKGLLYAAAEYKYIELYLDKLSEEWKKVYFLKMSGLSVDRFYFMARSGEFWTESKDGILELHQKIQKAVNQKIVSKDDCESWQNGLWEKLIIFLKNPNELYELLKCIYIKKWKRLKEISNILQQHKAYIFGAGRLGQFLHVYLQFQGIGNIIAFCDNNEQLQGMNLQGIPVISLEEAVNQVSEIYYIIATRSSKNRREMYEQLICIGVPKEQIELYDIEEDLQLLTMSDKMRLQR